VLPTLGKLFRPVRLKSSAAEEKIQPLGNFAFLKAFAFKNETSFVYVSRKSTIVLGLAYN
jgi:hypothetical protein